MTTVRHYQPTFSQHFPGIISGYVELTTDQADAELLDAVIEAADDVELLSLTNLIHGEPK